MQILLGSMLKMERLTSGLCVWLSSLTMTSRCYSAFESSRRLHFYHAELNSLFCSIWSTKSPCLHDVERFVFNSKMIQINYLLEPKPNFYYIQSVLILLSQTICILTI